MEIIQWKTFSCSRSVSLSITPSLQTFCLNGGGKTCCDWRHMELQSEAWCHALMSCWTVSGHSLFVSLLFSSFRHSRLMIWTFCSSVCVCGLWSGKTVSSWHLALHMLSLNIRVKVTVQVCSISTLALTKANRTCCVFLYYLSVNYGPVLPNLSAVFLFFILFKAMSKWAIINCS